MSQKMNVITKPEILHHGRGAHGPLVVGLIETRSTYQVNVRVVAAILVEPNIGYRVNVAVRYDAYGQWYKKQSSVCFSLRDALKRSYGLSRMNYGVTASRAFAGLLYDSVVPATEDIDS